MDPEKAHYLSMYLLGFALKIPIVSYFLKKSFELEHHTLQLKVNGIQYPNPVGLAAGFDKDGRWLNLLQTMGFGFIEVGTVTPRPQSGNEKPRLFRLIQDKSIINRMGFNNQGVDALVEKLKKFNANKKIIIGGNIGKNKDTTNENAVADYLYCFKALFNWVDYFAVNVSSPNTSNLRLLQEKEPLQRLLDSLVKENHKYDKPKPIYLKIAPDLDPESVSSILEVIKLTRIQGLIISNTTIRRPVDLREKALALEQGGLSGKALQIYADEVLNWVDQNNPELVKIAVGGIFNAEDAILKFNSGAKLIQIYSGMIFEGPWMVKKIKSELITYFNTNAQSIKT